MRIGPLGIWELLIILVVVLLIFGPRRLPEMAKGLGQSVREFRKGIKDMKDDFEEGTGSSKPDAEPNRAATKAAAPAAREEAAAVPDATGAGTTEEEAERPKAKADA